MTISEAGGEKPIPKTNKNKDKTEVEVNVVPVEELSNADEIQQNLGIPDGTTTVEVKIIGTYEEEQKPHTPVAEDKNQAGDDQPIG